MPLLFSGAVLEPLACGGLYWPAQGTLLVADLHLEKASHFAARGWPLPPWDSEVTCARLEAAVAQTGARRVVALGDSFHDPGGPGRLDDAVRARLAALAARVELVWVSGNHDGVVGAGLGGVAVEALDLGGLVLRHEAQAGEPRGEVSGHYHPKLTIRHRGRTMRRRCFALGTTKLILPAYGTLAGGLDVEDRAFAALFADGLDAMVCEAGQTLRFPIRPFTNALAPVKGSGA
jgi:hypothetical protein